MFAFLTAANGQAHPRRAPFCGETQRCLQTTLWRVISPCLRRRVQRVLGGDRPQG